MDERLRWIGIVGLVAALSAGCGDDDGVVPMDSGSPPDTSTGMDATTGSDTGTPDSGDPSDTGTPTDAGSGLVGNAEVSVINVPGTPGSYGAFVRFYPNAVTGRVCTQRTEGPCEIEVCSAFVPFDAGTPVDAGMPPLREAGDITISGGTEEVTLTHNGTNYPNVNGSMALYDGSQTLTFSAAGGTIAAFGGMITPPTNVTITSPDLLSGPITIDATSPWNITWDFTPDVTEGSIFLEANGTNGDGSYAIMSCTFDAAPESATVPVAAMSDLIGRDSVNTTFSVGADTYVTASGWNVRLTAYQFAGAATSTFE